MKSGKSGKSGKSERNHQRNVQISANNWVYRESFRRKGEKMIRLFYVKKYTEKHFDKIRYTDGIPLI